MIYTRTGDHGTTDLANGERCAKTDDRMEAVGALDELNAHLGLLLCQLTPDISEKLKTETTLILRIQRILFAIGAQAAAAPNSANLPTDEDIKALEKTMDAMVKDHELRFDGFRIPGGCTAAAEAHVARCICRRAERTTWRLGEEAIPACSLIFLNRLSDFLYLLSRKINALAGTEEKKV